MSDNPGDGRQSLVANVGDGRDTTRVSTSTPPVAEFRTASFEEYFELRRSPLPPPAELHGYERVVPGLADRIVKMAEAEGEHRRSRAQYALQTERVSLFVAATLVLLFFVGGFYAILQGKEIVGLVSLVAVLATLATAFIVGKRANTEIAIAEANGEKSDDTETARGESSGVVEEEK